MRWSFLMHLVSTTWILFQSQQTGSLFHNHRGGWRWQGACRTWTCYNTMQSNAVQFIFNPIQCITIQYNSELITITLSQLRRSFYRANTSNQIRTKAFQLFTTYNNLCSTRLVENEAEWAGKVNIRQAELLSACETYRNTHIHEHTQHGSTSGLK